MADKMAPNLTGPTPYSKSMSAKPGTIAQHKATTGRGGKAKFGGADGNKGRTADVEQPQSHAAFESLGTETRDEAG